MGSTNDYAKELQFRALEATSQKNEICTVIRGGTRLEVNPNELVVGDIMSIQGGDKIVADAIIVECDEHTGVMLDEAALTGESEAVQKNRSVGTGVRGRVRARLRA